MLEVEQERRRSIEALVRDWDEAEQAGLAATLARLNASLTENVARPARRPRCEG